MGDKSGSWCLSSGNLDVGALATWLLVLELGGLYLLPGAPKGRDGRPPSLGKRTAALPGCRGFPVQGCFSYPLLCNKPPQNLVALNSPLLLSRFCGWTGLSAMHMLQMFGSQPGRSACRAHSRACGLGEMAARRAPSCSPHAVAGPCPLPVVSPAAEWTSSMASPGF